MKYLIVQNQKSKQLYAVVAAENSAELDRELGQLMMRQAKLVELVSEAETLPFDSADALADHLIGVSVKPRKVMNAQDEPTAKVEFENLNEELMLKFTFGKHKSKTVSQILDNDPGYLKWAMDNVDWFIPSEELKGIINARINGKNNTTVMSTHPSHSTITPRRERRTGDPGLYSEEGENYLPF